VLGASSLEWTFGRFRVRFTSMKVLGERTHSRTSSALWLGAPLVLAACVAAEARPEGSGNLERASAQTPLSRRVRDGVACLAGSTRPAIDHAHVAFVFLTLERLSGGSALHVTCDAESIQPSVLQALDVSACRLDPGRTSSPISAP